MANCIVVSFEDGSVRVGYAVECTVETCAIYAQQAPGYVAHKIMDTSLLPMRVYREAWTLVGGLFLEVDMEKAKEIQRDLWRVARVPLLEALDVEWMYSQEINDTQTMTEIHSAKSALRDVTLTDLSQVTTPEELYAVWPAILGDR